MILETQSQAVTRKRGGAKNSGTHIALLVLSTLLLTAAGICLIYHLNVVGVVLLVLGIAARYIDSKI